MIQLSYISCATEPMSAEQLLALLQQCLTKNPLNGVTGMLLYGNLTFLQALEGEEQVIDGLFEKILKDPRHTNVQFLHRRSIECRQYSDWSMGFKRVSDKELEQVAGLRDFGERNFNFQYLIENKNVIESLMDHYRKPYWDPLVRELDAKDEVIAHLRKALAQTRGCVEIASLVLESVVDQSKKSALSEGLVSLCESALNSLRQN